MSYFNYRSLTAQLLSIMTSHGTGENQTQKIHHRRQNCVLQTTYPKSDR